MGDSRGSVWSSKATLPSPFPNSQLIDLYLSFIFLHFEFVVHDYIVRERSLKLRDLLSIPFFKVNQRHLKRDWDIIEDLTKQCEDNP